MKRTFLYTDEQSNKFWTIETNSNSYTVNYGKAGTDGQTQTKEFANEEACQKAADKLIAQKTKKGYVEQNNAVPNNSEKEQPITNKKENKQERNLTGELFLAIHYMEKGFEDIKKLIEQGADINADTPGIHGSMINEVAEARHPDSEKLLAYFLEKDADLTKKGHNQQGLADFAAAGNASVKMIEMLVAHGVDFSKVKIKNRNNAFFYIRSLQTGKSKDEIIKTECADLVERAEIILESIKAAAGIAKKEKHILRCFIIECEYSFDDLEINGRTVNGSYEDYIEKDIPELKGSYGAEFYRQVMFDLLIPRLEQANQEGMFDDIMEYRLEFILDYILAGTNAVIYNAIKSDRKDEALKLYKERLAQWKRQNYSDRDDYHEYILPVLLNGFDLMEPDLDEAWRLAELAMEANKNNVYDIDQMISRHALWNNEAGLLTKLGAFHLKSPNGDKEDGIIHLHEATRLGSKEAAKILAGGSDTFAPDEKTLDNEYLKATANDIKGHIDITMKKECEESYSQALDFVNNLLEKGFGEGTRGYMLSFESKKENYLPGWLPNVSVNTFFANALEYPKLHDKIAQYANAAIRQYTWYKDLDGEQCAMPGIFAAFGLALADRKYLSLLAHYYYKVDGEHQEIQTELVEPILKKYGVDSETIELTIAGLLSYEQSYSMNVAAITDDTKHIQLLLDALRHNENAYRVLEILFESREDLKELSEKHGEDTIRQFLLIWKRTEANVYGDEDDEDYILEDDPTENTSAGVTYAKYNEKKGLDLSNIKLPEDTDFNNTAPDHKASDYEIWHNTTLINKILTVILELSKNWNDKEQAILKQFIADIPNFTDMYLMNGHNHISIFCSAEKKTGEFQSQMAYFVLDNNFFGITTSAESTLNYDLNTGQKDKIIKLIEEYKPEWLH